MADKNAKPAKDPKGEFGDTQLDLTPPEHVVGEKPKPAATEQVPGLSDVFAALEKATAAKEDGKATSAPLMIANVEIPDPKTTLKNLEEALSMIPACVRPDPNDLFFKSLPGKAVGEATREGENVDPIMLLHPANRLAHVIAHESAHKKLQVPNEGLVERYLRAIGVVDDGHADAAKTTPKYDRALAGFSDFLTKMAKGGNNDAIAIEVYNLYYKSDYHAILEMYRKLHVDTLAPAEKDKAEAFFWEVFPELEYDNKGQTQAQSVFGLRKPTFSPAK